MLSASKYLHGNHAYSFFPRLFYERFDFFAFHVVVNKKDDLGKIVIQCLFQGEFRIVRVSFALWVEKPVKRIFPSFFN